MPYWSFLNFQDSMSPTMEQLSLFNDHSMIFVLMLSVISLYIVFIPFLQSSLNKYCMESQDLEFFWTITPSIVLLMIAFPSMKILYLMEESSLPLATIKAVGHQWYWSYEFLSNNDESLDSFMGTSNLHRLMKNGPIVSIEYGSSTRLLTYSEDVIHSWTIPCLGIKVDALPGRLNQLMMTPQKPGLFFGQCSEICGANHSFMPISLLVKKIY